ncbi:hypothetical protein SSP531S_59610 [Streptomyces spongiicola]|uniref:Uncharacterized protein n=1 Tax=Streptomyces spongiicola TaxID=1690221 RepID=A0A2S1YWC0_9ACTN|nr:hypothetical protein [Streptomyces spongiicola]AWK08356.1 hypothetical protein DDQ41_04755 [Streptomyces spongiicola]GBQ04464.1 hypothetical protein SSP531S_59610 [Streptomyces spongiicola]
MSNKRGDLAVPPPKPGEYKIRFGARDVGVGWQALCAEAPTNTADAWFTMRTGPAPAVQTSRHHQLKYDLATAFFNGKDRDQWQIEVTSGGRVWYVVEEERKTVWLLHAAAKHPKRTE